MKNHHKKTIFRVYSLCLAAFVLVAQVALFPLEAQAAQITDRSLELQSTTATSDGGSMRGGLVRHKFKFTIPTGTNIGSIKFEYCTTAADVGALTCQSPEGLNVGSATLAFEGDSAIQSMVMHTINANSYYLGRAAAFVPAGATVANFTIGNVTNPTIESLKDVAAPDPYTNAPSQSFYVRISTYPTLDASGTPTHRGTVTASVNEQIVLDGTMPESLVFCTGRTVGTTTPTSEIPDCSTATRGTVSFNQLFSSTATASATSQMAASTNAGGGYVITVNGPTLTSGTNTITPMGTHVPLVGTTAAASAHGVSQFGLNLMNNTVDTVTVGSLVAPAANTTNLRGQPMAGYNTSDLYAFHSGDEVANSGNSVLGATDGQIYTVTYIVNVPGSQPAGSYTTTLTYICTPTF